MSAGKNVLADPWVNCASPLLVRDGMNERNARVIQGAVDTCEKFPIGSFADVFEHSYRDDPVILRLMLPIIL